MHVIPNSEAVARLDLPSGTVTFLFTDIEGSTRLLDGLGAEAYAGALAQHRSILREVFARHGGVEVDTQGDAFFVAFPTAQGALAAARQAVARLAEGPVDVRIGIHTGTPQVTDEGYVGTDVHRAARIAAAGHGGQVLVSGATAALVGAAGLRDLGQHWLKDLSAPERIYQAGDGEFSALKSLHQTNLPVAATTFLGRRQELSELDAILRRPEVRLLTLTGAGGTGKTRLALQAASTATSDFPGGVWWVPLASLRDSQLVLTAAAKAAGAQGDLAEHIGDSVVLLILDNFEQLAEAAVDLSTLLARCPRLKLLVTSREPLHLSGEHQYAVAPLAPDEASQLFLARARAVDREFVDDGAVAEICRRLDELPLAIELAAARVTSLSAAEILARLDRRLPLLTGGPRDLPERQRTLRSAIAWSHELLTSEEKRVFARLAVFRGGCTVEAAEAVAGADVNDLRSLVDKSLLRHRDNRYSMLETIREYAAERLEESDEGPALYEAHAKHFLALAEEAAGRDLRWEPGEWLDRLELDHDNLRAALDHLGSTGKNEATMHMVVALWRFWQMNDHWAEGRRRLADALAADERPSTERAEALNGAAALDLDERGDAAAATEHAEEALRLHQMVGNPWGEAFARYLLGQAASEEQDWKRAQDLWVQSADAFRELGDPNYELLANRLVAWTFYELGERGRGRVAEEENLRRARAVGNKEIEASVLGVLAEYALDEGRVGDAGNLLSESIRLTQPDGMAVALCRVARLFAEQGDADSSARLLGCSDVLHEQQRTVTPSWLNRLNEATVKTILGQLDEGALSAARNAGRQLAAEHAMELALEKLGARTEVP